MLIKIAENVKINKKIQDESRRSPASLKGITKRQTAVYSLFSKCLIKITRLKDSRAHCMQRGLVISLVMSIL